MISESVPHQASSRTDPTATGGAAAGHDAAPPVIDSARRPFVLPLVIVAGLTLLLAAVPVLVKWNVPLPRCAFKTVTGFPCFTCGSTRALLALGRLEFMEALRLNPLFTLACAAMPIWLGIALLKTAFAPRLRLRSRVSLKSILLLLAIGGIANWAYLLLALPR